MSQHRRGYHPEQSLWCAIVSFVLGPKQRGGVSWHLDGTCHWWQCDRCCGGDSSL